MILLCSLSADKDLQFHVVKQARAQSVKEGTGYSEGKQQADAEMTLSAFVWRALVLVSPVAASFIPLVKCHGGFFKFIFNILSLVCFGA